MEVEIELSCLASDKTLPILTGAVRPKGTKLKPFTAGTADESSRGMLSLRFDVAEMSLASFLKAYDDGMPLVGLPIFPNRKFLHQYIFCPVSAGIQGPKDLKGRTVGVPQFWMTSSIWQRGLLLHEYGVDPRALTWKVGGAERLESMSLPQELRVEVGSNPEEKLLTGEIDAFLTARTPQAFLRHPDRVVRPFRDLRHAIVNYHKKTGLFPIMHLVVMKRALWDRYGWLAESLCEAFQAAKAQAIQALQDEARTMLPLMRSYLEETRDLFGSDPWPYGLRKNLRVLETFLRYAREQGLIRNPVEVRDLFAPNSVDFFD